mgnify:CR=1 FL=1
MKRLCVSVSVLAFRIAELLIVVSGLLLLLSRMWPVGPALTHRCLVPSPEGGSVRGAKDKAMSE